MHTQRCFPAAIVEFISRRCLVIALCLLFGLLASVGLGADQNVSNTADSGAGSLRQAVADVDAGENVNFHPAVAGQTINLSSDLDVLRSMNFVNSSTGDVTVNLNANSVVVSTGSAVGLDDRLRIEAVGTGSTWTYAVTSDSSYTIAGLDGTVAATTDSGHAHALYNSGFSDLNITNGLSGVVTANANALNGYAYGADVYHSLNIDGGLSGTIDVYGYKMATGLHAAYDINIADGFSGIISVESETSAASALNSSMGVNITGGFSGTITADSVNGSARGIDTMGDIDINGGLSGTVSVNTANRGMGLYSDSYIRITDGLSGTIEVHGDQGAHGLHGRSGVDIADGFTGSVIVQSEDGGAVAISGIGALNITDGFSGTLTAVSVNGSAIGSLLPVIIDGGFSGTLTADSANGDATGIYMSVDIDGGFSGTIAATSVEGDAYGINTDVCDYLSISGGLSGTVNATSETGGAYGLCSEWGDVNGGDADTPLVITGSVLAQGGNEAIAIGGMDINVKVDAGGTLSAVCSGGTAWAVRTVNDFYNQDLQQDDRIELVAGCTVVGGIDLGEGTDTITLSGTTASTTFNDDILSTESINVTGGTWTLNGQISSGTVLTVLGGTLLTNSDISGDMTIGPGGTLGGSGQFGNLVNNGTVAPGNSIGTLTVAGDYTQNPGSTLEVEINDAGQCDLLDITGTATLNGGTVDVQAESGTYTAGMTYTFLDADGGRTGTFDDISDNLLFFDAVLSYGGNTVGFTLEHSPYVAVAQTFNQRGVAGYLDDHYGTATGDFATVLGELDTLTASQARAAFDATSGELYGSLSTVGIESMDRFMRTVARRLRARSLTRGLVPPAAGGSMLAIDDQWDDSIAIVRGQEPCELPWWRPNRWQSWAEGYGVGAAVAGDGNASGLGYSVGGVAFGIEDDLDANTLLGFVGGYSQVYTLLDQRADRGTIDSAQAGVYLHHGADLGYATAIAAYGHNGYDTLRHVVVGSINRTATADYDGNNFSFYLEAGRNIQGRAAHLQPYAALEYIQLHQNDFVEAGANSVDLAVGGVQADAFRGLLGTRLVGYFQTCGGRLVSLEGRALWRHEFLDETRLLDAQFSGQPGSAFTIKGVNVDRDAAILGGGVTLCLADGVKLYANYDVLTSENYTAHAGSGGLMLLW